MGVERKHGIWAVDVGGSILGGISQQNVRTGTQVAGESTDGEVYVRHQSINEQKPVATWTTNWIATALALIGLTGKAIEDLGGGLSLYAQKHAKGGTRAGAGSHRKYNMTEGLILPQALSVQHRGDATLSYLAAATFDGNNDPVVPTDNVSLPGGLSGAERFTLGPATIESVSLPQIRSFELNFGLTAEGEGADSDIWDTIISIADIAPVFTLRGIDVEWFKSTNIPLTGKAASHANTAVYLKKRASGGTFVANGVAEHIKFTAAGLAHIEDAFDGSGNETGECSLVMPLKYDGANDPVVINTAAPIS